MQSGDSSPTKIRLWLMRVPSGASEDTFRSWDRLLDVDEKERRNRLHGEVERLRYTLGHGLLRVALSGLAPELHPQDWRFCHSDKGRPEIANPGTVSNIAFSLSYTEGLLGCAVAPRGPLGMDIEKVTSKYPYEDVLSKTLSIEERKNLEAMPAGSRRERFFEFWTLKESYLKAIGVGLEPDLTSLSFNLIDESRIDADVGDNRPWHFELLVPLPDYRLALASADQASVEVQWAEAERA